MPERTVGADGQPGSAEAGGYTAGENEPDLPLHPRVLRIALRGARIAAAAGLALAAVALLSDWLPFRLLPAGRTPTEPDTAVALVLLAGALLWTLPGSGTVPRPRAARPPVVTAAVVAAAVVGLLALGQYATGIDLHIDTLLLHGSLNAAAAAGHPAPAVRMAPNTALALVLAAAAQLALLSGRRRLLPVGQTLALLELMLGQSRLYGSVYGVQELGRLGGYPGMTITTALVITLLGAAAFLSRPDQGLAALLTNAGTTGLLGRWMVGATLTLLPLFGWAQLAGQDAGWFSSRLGVALLVCGRVSALLLGTFGALLLARRLERARTRAERKVGEYAQLRAFMDHTPAVIFTRDLDGRYLAANSRFTHVNGVTRAQVIGAAVEELLPAEAAAAARAADRVARVGGTTQLEEVVVQQDGPHHYLTTLFPLTDAAGTPYAVCGVALDVTDRLLAQREADRLQRRFRDLLEAGPDATVISDGDGIVVMVNAQTEKLFGHARDELVGRPLSLLLPERPGAQQAERRPELLLAMGAERDLRARHRDGHDFPVEMSTSPLETEDGLLVFSAIRDVTERRQAEAERQALYEQQRHIALTLQHSLMGTPPELPRLLTASRYLASAQEAGVGGDWFDLIPLDGDRIGILIGDVMGRGVDAAAVMGQLRAAAHALAQTGMSPARLMTALDVFLSELPDQLVTCCYLVVDPDAAEVTVCSAGHLPTLLAAPGRPPLPLEAPISVPLGVGGVPHRQATCPLPRGSTLALYTDGLVETSDSDIDDRIQMLADTLEAALADGPVDAHALDQAACRLLTTLIPDSETHNDDVTLLLVRVPDLR